MPYSMEHAQENRQQALDVIQQGLAMQADPDAGYDATRRVIELSMLAYSGLAVHPPAMRRPWTVCRLHLARADVEHDSSQWVRQNTVPSSHGKCNGHFCRHAAAAA